MRRRLSWSRSCTAPTCLCKSPRACWLGRVFSTSLSQMYRCTVWTWWAQSPKKRSYTDTVDSSEILYQLRLVVYPIIYIFFFKYISVKRYSVNRYVLLESDCFFARSLGQMEKFIFLANSGTPMTRWRIFWDAGDERWRIFWMKKGGSWQLDPPIFRNKSPSHLPIFGTLPRRVYWFRGEP